MSVIEKSVQLGKDLFAINRKTTKDIVAIQVSGVRRYIETNVGALRNAADITSFPQFAEASKAYNASLLAGVQSDLLAGREVVKGAVAETRSAISSARGVEAPKSAQKTTAKKTTRKTATRKQAAPRKPRATAAKKAA